MGLSKRRWPWVRLGLAFLLGVIATAASVGISAISASEAIGRRWHTRVDGKNVPATGLSLHPRVSTDNWTAHSGLIVQGYGWLSTTGNMHLWQQTPESDPPPPSLYDVATTPGITTEFREVVLQTQRSYPHQHLTHGQWNWTALYLGWPMYSAVGVRLVHSKIQSLYEEIASYESGWHEIASTSAFSGQPTPTVIATRIIPLGAVINTAAYMPMAFILVSLPLWIWNGVARIVREYYGHCPRCSYDLHHNLTPGCPECGWQRRAPREPANQIES